MTEEEVYPPVEEVNLFMDDHVVALCMLSTVHQALTDEILVDICKTYFVFNVILAASYWPSACLIMNSTVSHTCFSTFPCFSSSPPSHIR